MEEPRASRPYMPGYGVLDAGEGSGLLPWSWASDRLTRSHDYWLATVSPTGGPHVMPVWGVWADGCLWFSSSRRSRKARNLDVRHRAVMTTDDAQEPVVVEGDAERVGETAGVARFVDKVNEKYATSYGLDFFDPDVNACFRLRPSWVFALASDDFTGSPTRWTFAD